MSYDFRADQVRTSRLISSGSAPILVYPSSSALNLQGDLVPTFSTSSVGADVFLFVSGSSQQKTVFGGDVVVSGAMTASIRTTNGAADFIVGSDIDVNYNSLGQWELTGSVRRLSIAGYARTNLTNATLIGFAYINPSEYGSGIPIMIEAVGMNMNSVSGGLSLYNQNNGTTDAILTWSGVDTLTTGSYVSASLTWPASAKTYELHLSQSGGVSGGSNYTSVGFVNFRIG